MEDRKGHSRTSLNLLETILKLLYFYLEKMPDKTWESYEYLMIKSLFLICS